MEKELFTLFPSFEELAECPQKPADGYYVFRHAAKASWFRIHQKDISPRDHALLRALFTEIKPKMKPASPSIEWLDYLEGTGEPPITTQAEIRVIQLFFEGQAIEEADLKEASCAFFGKAVQLVTASPQRAYLIESKTCAAQEPESFSSYISALESDFYIQAKIYIGKFQPADACFPTHFATEKDWFEKALFLGGAERLYTMEKLFPVQLTQQMPDGLKDILRKEVLEPLEGEPEILGTVRAFFENGFNASVTAKKLYIHRNTLQYRLNKFQEITCISSKDFNGVLVAYCASLAAENSGK